jgi:hypothetical protein
LCQTHRRNHSEDKSEEKKPPHIERLTKQLPEKSHFGNYILRWQVQVLDDGNQVHALISVEDAVGKHVTLPTNFHGTICETAKVEGGDRFDLRVTDTLALQ